MFRGYVRSITVMLSVILVAAVAQAFSPDKGRALYERKCERCHGEDGEKGARGAENLRESRMTDQEVIKIITEGKRKMPAYGTKLTREEIAAVAAYVKTLRK